MSEARILTDSNLEKEHFMGSALNGLGSLNTLTLIDSLNAPASPATVAAPTNEGESAASHSSGDFNGLLSDSLAVGVMQISDSASGPSGAGTDMLIAAYTPAEHTAASLSTNPALAIIQTVEGAGDLAMGQAAG